jgi:tRNA-specific 2-thiouridylase
VAAGRPIYVVKVDPGTNTVFVGDKHHLETQKFKVLSVNWLEEPQAYPIEAMVKIRYNTPPTLGMVYPSEAEPGQYVVELYAPQMAITPGQIAAFYDPDFEQLWGGGYIEQFIAHQVFDPEIKKELPNLYCQV